MKFVGTIIKNVVQQYKINCWFWITYESPRGLSNYDLFTNFSA